MNSEAEVSVLTAQQRSLLEALPCYVFVQRGKNVIYANRGAREILHLEDGALLPIDDLFVGKFPGFVYANPGRRREGPRMSTAPAATRIRRFPLPDAHATGFCGVGPRELPYAPRRTGAGTADRCTAVTARRGRRPTTRRTE